MHYVANVEVVDPVIELLEAKSVANSDLELFDLLNRFDFFKVMEADIELVTLSHEVFFSIASEQINIPLLVSNLLLCELLKLEDLRGELGQDGICHLYYLREDLNLLLNVVDFGPLPPSFRRLLLLVFICLIILSFISFLLFL